MRERHWDDRTQPANAQRLFGLGLDVAVRPKKGTSRRWLPHASRRSTTRGIGERRGFQRRILGLHGIDALVADLTLTGTRHREQRAGRP